MDYKEEQSNEIEAIQSIYGSDYTEVSKSPLTYEILVIPTTTGEIFHVAAQLRVSYPPTYPDVPPILKVKRAKGISDSGLKDLQELCEKIAKESLGVVCIFTIAEAMKEWLIPRNVPEKTLFEEAMERHKAVVDSEAAEADAKAAEAQAEEEAKMAYHSLVPVGTIVTRESFAEWQRLFAAEQAQLEAKRLEENPASAVDIEAKKNQLTGRQIFERNLTLGLDEAEESGGNEVFWFNEDAYKDVDLPPEDEEDQKAAIANFPRSSDDAGDNDDVATAAAAAEIEEDGDGGTADGTDDDMPSKIAFLQRSDSSQSSNNARAISQSVSVSIPSAATGKTSAEVSFDGNQGAKAARFESKKEDKPSAGVSKKGDQPKKQSSKESANAGGAGKGASGGRQSQQSKGAKKGK